MAFSWTAWIVSAAAVIVSGAVAWREGNWTRRPGLAMGFANHAGMWDDLVLLSIANAIVVPHLSWGWWVLAALVVATAASCWVHHHWYRGDRAHHSSDHMWPARRRGTWYGDLSWAGWLHVAYVIGELTLLIGFLLYPLPWASVLVVAIIFSIHVPIGLLQPRWFLTGRLATPRQQPLLIPLLAVLWVVAGVKLASTPDAPRPVVDRAALPAVMLWAWERPEDLRALDPSVGVAFLAQTITIDDGELRIARRRQPLRVHPQAILSAVTRVESRDPGLESRALADTVAAAIVETASMRQVRGVQVDFDATASQRAFYQDLLARIRATLASHVPLSITALASWCVGDRWLAHLPVDEAVPMLFDMGPVDAPYRALATSPRAGAAECAGAVGVSLDEPLTIDRGARRLYLFNERAWSADALRNALPSLTP